MNRCSAAEVGGCCEMRLGNQFTDPFDTSRGGATESCQPCFGGDRADVGLGDRSQLDPSEVDPILAAFDYRWCGLASAITAGRSAPHLFYVEHEVDLVVPAFLSRESPFARQGEFTDTDSNSRLFKKLACERSGGRFTELDVATGEVAVSMLHISAEQDMGAVEQAAAGDDLDIVVGISVERGGRGGQPVWFFALGHP